MSATESDSDQADGAWGQLLRPDGTIALCLHRDEERIGRLETSSLVINHPKVSSLHARVTRTGPSIEDCSSNGLWLDGVKVGRGNSRILGPNAQLSFGVSPASAADNLRFSFVACSAGAPADTAAAASGSMQGGDSNVTRAEPVGPASAPAAAPAGAAVAGEAAPSGPAAPAGPSSDAGVSSDSIVQDITCGICQDVLYNAVALQPCLHSFCAGCACTWLKRKRECPQCRCKIKVASRNHTVNSIVEDFLSRHPERRRSIGERQMLDADDTIGSSVVNYSKRRRRDHPSGSPSSDYDSADDSDGFGSGAADMAAFLAATLAGAVLPAHLPQMAACAGCGGYTPAALMAPLDSYSPDALPSTALCNSFERSALLRILQEKGVSVSQMLRDCLGRVALGTMRMPAASGGRGPKDNCAGGAAPSGGSRPVCASALACHGCRSDALASLAYQYRVAIPRAELPTDIAERQDCWYGHTCRTQRHNTSHAERLNHICEPRPPAPKARPRQPNQGTGPPPRDGSTDRDPVIVD